MRYQALGVALAFLLGIAAGRWLPLIPLGWATGGLGALLLAALARRRSKRAAWGILLFACALLGIWRRQAALPDFHAPTFIAAYADWPAEATVVGVLSEPPDCRDTYANLRVQSERLRFSGEPASPVHGLLLARVPLETAQGLRYGDRVVLSGALTRPATGDTFSYRDYLAREGIFVQMSARRVGVLAHGQGNPLLTAIYALRTRAHAVVRRLWPEPEASLLAGILLGQDKGIPRPVYDAFRTTGTAHIIAISGFNITILAGLFLALFGRLLGRGRGALVAALAIAAYTVLVGADAAVVRAAVMGLLGMAALQLGRRQHAYTTLAVTGAAMAAATPTILSDIGFQLSFAATLGLLLFAQPLQNAAERVLARWLAPQTAHRWAAPLGEFFLFTLAAQAMTLPISAWHFGRISLISFVANPLILPVQAPLMVGAGLAVLAGLLWLPLGQAAAWSVWPLAAYTIRTVQALAAAPLTTIAVTGFGVGGVALYYAALALLVLLWQRRATWQPRLGVSLPRVALLPVLAVGAALVWGRAAQRPDGRLTVTFLPVGNGSAALVRTPPGRWLLIGGGERGSLLTAAVGQRLPWGEHLDWWVVGATRDEAITALLTALDSLPPRRVWWAGRASSSASRRLHARLDAGRIPIITVEKGASLDLGEGARLEALAVGARGGVFLLQWQRFRLLLPLGMDFQTLAALQSQTSGLTPTAMLLAESGYAPLNPPAWIRALGPRLLVLSVRPADPYGRPALSLLQELQAFPLVRTDRCGSITLHTDGERLWLTTEKRCLP